MNIHKAIAIGLAALAVFCLAMALLTAGAFAQIVMCADRDAIVAQLKGRYHETRQGIGVMSETNITELYVSAEGTWTVLMTMANGKACIIAAGDDWQEAPDAIRPGKGA